MRREFLIWLFTTLCAAFLVTAVLIYSQSSIHAKGRAESVMNTRLSDLLDFLQQAEQSISFLTQANDASATGRARALAEIVSLDGESLRNQERLQELCNKLGAEQIALTDGENKVEAAIPQSLVGLTLEGGNEIRPVVQQDETGESIISAFGEFNRNDMQYASVRRLDAPGCLRLGFLTRLKGKSHIDNSLKDGSIKLKLGENGSIVIFRRGVRLTDDTLNISDSELLSLPQGRVKSLRSKGRRYFAYAMVGGGFRVIGILPVSSVYRTVLRTMQTLLLSNLVLFIMMFCVVSWLLQRIVIRGISQVNASLREITEGDLERKVEVLTCPEFTLLSNGINFMVDSLRSMGEERQFQVKRDLELARAIQTASLPNKFPAFPNVPEFDLCATCLQAHEVGGDFYDFYMPDNNHLHFLVADVDASGIPAALFMMRAMSLIRTLARGGDSPAKIVSEANRELSDSGQASVAMALFYACLDIHTGRLTYTCAGRTHCLLQRLGYPYEELATRADTVIGGQDDDAQYHTYNLTLIPGERLFVYTSGILHATNASNTPYNEDRLKDVLKGETANASDTLLLVRSSLRQYTEGEKLPRDIAMLCLRYCGEPSNSVQLSFPAGESQKALESLEQQMMEFFAAPPDIEAMKQALSQVLSSLPETKQVQLLLDCTEHQVLMEFSYSAPNFNPLKALTDLPVDRTSHNFTNNTNTLTICKNLV